MGTEPTSTVVDKLQSPLFACLFLLCGCAGPQTSPPNVLHYEPALVQLTGTVVLENFYGPPGYGENPETDSRERYAILMLDRPVSVAGDLKSELNTCSFEDVEQMQLVSLTGPRFTPYDGAHVLVTGTLYQGITGHHHTDVLLTVRSIRRR